MINIFIDDKPFKVKEGTTVLKAAEEAGAAIPHLCFHSAFPPEGSCRMCLVEIEGLPKLELACSTQVREGMKVSTRSEKVIEARKGVLEFLLAEHPPDCPICDKAGECKLQDYYEEYGLFDNRFREYKEKKQKNVKIGKSLILDQERCILCTRCVRFLRDITKTRELGVFNRGLHSEINTYNGEPVNNNYSGNLAEICPVGAITDSDFRFKTRNWFLKEGESICPLCSRGCNIYIESHKGFARFPVPKRVYRIKSRENHKVNGFWICDLGRYGYSYLDEERLNKICVNNGKGNLTWQECIVSLADEIKKLHSAKKASRIALILNLWLSNEELFLIKKIFVDDLGVKNIYFVDSSEGETDDFLLTSERCPNKRGAQEIGYDLKPLDSENLMNKTDLLLIFGMPVYEPNNLAEIKALFENVKTKIYFSSHSDELCSLADIVLPTALIPEKEGSLTNVDGIVQKFLQVLEAPGECRPEWKVFVDLGRELGININYYKQFNTPEVVLKEMRKEISFFENKSE
ncbi:MAG: 2Fe-2S iron-sulfur cluster-binding protein [Candidatus Aminicenantaceae bacterium]